MSFRPLLPPELWLLIFRFAISHRRPTSSLYIPFESQGNLNNLEKDLQVKRSLVLVCRFWRALATHLLYEDIRIRHGSVHLKKRLTGNDETEGNFGYFVRRAVLPYDQTVSNSQQSLSAIDILKECPQLETLVRPRRGVLDNLVWEFPTPDISLPSLTRLEWWHYNDAARTGGINSFQDVLQGTPFLRYLSIGGELWITHCGTTVHLPKLTTLRLCRMNTLFVQLVSRWSLPSLSHVIAQDNGHMLENIWNAFGPQLEVVEFGAHIRFYLEDQISYVLPKCPNLKQLNYYVMFTIKPETNTPHPSVTSVRLNAHPCGLIDLGKETTLQVDAHLKFICSPVFPKLRELILYGDWRSIKESPEFLHAEQSMITRGISIVFEQRI